MKQVPHEDPASLYNKALAQEISGNLDGAYETFIYIWKTFPKHELGSKALYNAASITARTDSANAVNLYQTFIKSYPRSEMLPKAKTLLIELYIRGKNYLDSQRLFTDIFAQNKGPDMVGYGLDISKGLIESKQYSNALEIIANIYPLSDSTSRDVLLGLWTSAVENIDQVDVLAKFETTTSDDQLIDLLLARQARLYLEQEDQDIASRIMERLRNKTMQLSAQDKTARNTIGVVVPLTGKWETVGQKVLKGIEFASRVFSDEKAPNVEYVIKDYGSDESSIAGIIEDLDKNHKVISIIGPIGEVAGSISCNEAQARGIPSFMFTRGDISSKQESYCFRNFISVDTQVTTLLQVASDLNITRFAILYPTDHFGNIFTNLFIENAPNYGIEIVRQVGYSPQLVDFKEAVNTLIAHLKQPVQDETIETDQDIRIEPDFDALLIPDTAINAAMIASYLPYFSIDGVRLFGPTLWDTPDFIRVGGKYVDDAIFVSGFFINSQLDFVQEFNNSFYYTFGYSPSVWEAGAYDTAVILQNLLEGEIHTRESLREQIASVKDYPGLTGATSFYTDGSVDKAIYVLTVKGATIYEIVP
ncbi:MAG: ABC transporter substrate-binding protein [Deltaproteobacteria bacterium]|nr:ABC transporter substrate-binding protein [Deltaproteobacteria bacterium]